jgi:hypothetical protein
MGRDGASITLRKLLQNKNVTKCHIELKNWALSVVASSKPSIPWNLR